MHNALSSSRTAPVPESKTTKVSRFRGDDLGVVRDLATVTEGSWKSAGISVTPEPQESVTASRGATSRLSDLSRSSLSKQDRNWIRYQREVCVAGWVSFILASAFIYVLARFLFVAFGAL